MKYILRILAVLAIVILAIFVAFAYRIRPRYDNKGINKLDKGSSKDKIEEVDAYKVFDGDKPLRILLLGIDKSETRDRGDSKSNTRTDTIMLFSIFPKEKKVQIVSVPRDSYVTIHGWGKHKVNSAFNPKVYPDGGLDLTVKTVEDYLEVPIDHYALVDYDAVTKIVDAVGGVDVVWDHDDYTYIDDWVVPPLEISLKRGINHLDGEGAVRYLRTRKAYQNQDLGRIESQQNFLLLLFDKMKSPAIILKVPEIIDIVDQYVETDFNYAQLASLAKFGLGLERDDIHTATLEGRNKSGVNLGGYVVDVYELNHEKALDLVKNFPANIEEKSPAEGQLDNSKVQEENK
ncbi:LCP family protein [Peptoniphilus catoniae]|uniref:LCP family protein n=1 Tax=Peptoniphilus catoniae TaxID=1660341 RepID=UPI0010FD33AB|nr:LCP family protein [Peptoniphilus catoniae]